MESKLFVTANTVSKELGVSRSHGYKVVHDLNMELQKRGFMVVAGRVSRKYYEECFHGVSKTDKVSTN